MNKTKTRREWEEPNLAIASRAMSTFPTTTISWCRESNVAPRRRIKPEEKFDTSNPIDSLRPGARVTSPSTVRVTPSASSRESPVRRRGASSVIDVVSWTRFFGA